MNSNTLRILMITPEMTPYAKSGGLADVLGTLPRMLSSQHIDVRVMMPAYGSIPKTYLDAAEYVDTVGVPVGAFTEPADIYTLMSETGQRVYFIGHDHYFDSRHDLYGTSAGDYTDNDARFIFFCRSIFETLKCLNWQPDILHCHDWQTALVPAYLKCLYASDPFFKHTRSLITIHNLAHQGLFPKSRFPLLNLPWSEFTPSSMEFYGDSNFLKAGLVHADIITTVSPAYSREIQRTPLGCGLEGLLQVRARQLHGILNGIDPRQWNPATDPFIAKNYSAFTLAHKSACKKYLKQHLGLYFPSMHGIPLIGMVARIVEQKGFELLLNQIDRVMECEVQMVIMGTGDRRYCDMLTAAARRHQGKLVFVPYYSELTERQIYAGCDLFLMPSRYEPCGLTQMIAMRYGAVPIVFKTGGLADTVEPVNSRDCTGNGIVFDRYEPAAFLAAIQEGLRLFHDTPFWQMVAARGMRREFSWKRSAQHYVSLYQRAIGCLPIHTGEATEYSGDITTGERCGIESIIRTGADRCIPALV